MVTMNNAIAIFRANRHHVVAALNQAFLIRIKRDHGSIDLEWLRFIPRAKAKAVLALPEYSQQYIIPDDSIILHNFDPRVSDDRNPYLLVIRSCSEDNVKATILIPSRTANGGMFPLNGTYFQENESQLQLQTSK
ncbi:hypothetical protein E2562_038115 [Oryza meyeriana var. granulata]|uniref:Demeter RRM-fold domain-containing protein n=1 Tax=Oryza meyeriana var. granulata TaxID=110450 RepID=A0A6G1C2P4_9ORYZ|nr:hypothetical protein E2562_038115 [Oryza meyeriana var. granulata]